MKILFCNIARMKYYKGIIAGVDEPQYGGEYVARTGDAYEKFNFSPLQEGERQKCFGFFETKSTNGASSNQLHLERIEGVPRKAEEAEQVLVVWCSTHHQNESVIVGWYKNATVLRYYDVIDVTAGDGSVYQQTYNVEANAEDCVLLPMGERNRHCWWAPRRKATRSFGFGQANVWFAEEESAENYIQKVVEQINAYRGENWLWKWPDEGSGER